MSNLFNFQSRRQNALRCILLGANFSGKTTLLYMWQTGCVHRIIPTVGLNMAVIRHAGITMQVFDFGACVGTGDLVRPHLNSTTGVLFLHALDSTEEEYQESMRLLKFYVAQLLEARGKHFWIMVTKHESIPFVQLGVKRTEFYRSVLDVFQEFDSQIVWKIFDDRELRPTSPPCAWPVFDEIAVTLEYQDVVNKKVPLDYKYDEKQLRERIVQEAATDVPVEKFWKDFLSADLAHWSHRNYLRAGFLVLLKSAGRLEDLWTAVDTFLGHIDRLRRKKPDLLENASHRTMTTFWLYTLQLSIMKFREAHSHHRLPQEHEFQELVLADPHLADSSYWEVYYSHSLMFTVRATGNWCLPDKKALPISVEEQDTRQNFELGFFVQQLFGDSRKFDGLAADDLEGQCRLICIAIDTVQQYLNSGEQSQKVIAEALVRSQQSTLQLRASKSGRAIPPYSETQAYFWIRVVHGTLHPIYSDQQTYKIPGPTLCFVSNEPNNKIVKILTYSQFSHAFRVDPRLWKHYYSYGLWTSIKGRMDFVSPDLRSLPDLAHTYTSSIMEMRSTKPDSISASCDEKAEASNDDSMYRLAIANSNIAEIATRINAIVAAVEEKLTQASWVLVEGMQFTKRYSDIPASISISESHVNLLLMLFTSWQKSTEMSTKETDVPLFVSLVLGNNQKESILKPFRELEKFRSSNITNPATPVANATTTEAGKIGSTEIGVTQLLFYARLVVLCSKRSEPNKVIPRRPHTIFSTETTKVLTGCDDDFSLTEFRAFLSSQPLLVSEDIPMRYYRSETWFSAAAKTMVVPSDRQPLPGVIE